MLGSVCDTNPLLKLHTNTESALSSASSQYTANRALPGSCDQKDASGSESLVAHMQLSACNIH